MAESWTMSAALNRALRDALADDPRVLVFGEDVGRLGGVFRVTDGLQAKFGAERVFDTPISEAGIAGTAVGPGLRRLALRGRDAVRRVLVPGARAGDRPRREDARTHPRTGRHADHDPDPVVRWHQGQGAPRREPRDLLRAHGRAEGGRALDRRSTRTGCCASRSPTPTRWSCSSRRRATGRKEEGDLTTDGPGIGEGRVLREGDACAIVTLRRDGGPGARGRRRAGRRRASRRGSSTCARCHRSTRTSSRPRVRDDRTGRRRARGPAHPRDGAPRSPPASMELAFDFLEAPVARVTGWDVPYPPASLEQHYLPERRADRGGGRGRWWRTDGRTHLRDAGPRGGARGRRDRRVARRRRRRRSR